MDPIDRLEAALTITGLGRSMFYDKQNPKSKYYDADLPSPIQLGDRAVGWRRSKLEAWVVLREQKAEAKRLRKSQISDRRLT